LSSRPLALAATDIAKSFAGVRALKGVSFDLRAGEVHALVGENGAGKSTLIKIITGAETADAGSLSIDGHIVPQMDPATARSLGIAAIYQHPALFPHLTVAENIATATEPPGAWRRVDWRARRRKATDLLDRVGARLDPDRIVSSLSMPEQQIVEIARALGTDARIMVMDEPTASLTTHEVEHLFTAIGLLTGHGVGVIYISHRLDEVFTLADRVTVLRDGETVATRARKDVTRDEITRLMVGPSEPRLAPSEPRTFRSGETALDLRHITNTRAGVHDITLSVARGEILGLAGLVGSGRTALAETIFGLSQADSGEVLVAGQVAHIRSPAQAMRRGLAYVPEDRRRHAVVTDLSITANTSLADLARVSHAGLIDPAAERALAERYVERLRIKTTSVDMAVSTLSGGNQQKVALARWLATNPSVLILDEPTQGVDVGAKAEIHALMRELAADGLAIVLISSDLPEILAMSDRIAVMHSGRISGVLDAEDATAERVLALALGDGGRATPGGSAGAGLDAGPPLRENRSPGPSGPGIGS